MSKASGQNGKGSARRRENTSKIRAHWDEIQWYKKPIPPGAEGWFGSEQKPPCSCVTRPNDTCPYHGKPDGPIRRPNPLDKKPQS